MNTPTILVPRFTNRRTLNQFWRQIRQTWIAQFLCHEAQAFAASKMLRGDRSYMERVAPGLFGRPLCGAGYAWESRQPLNIVPGQAVPLVTTGANTVNFLCEDNFSVQEVDFVWQVAGTVTALTLYFDKYAGPNATGTKSAGLTGTQTDGQLIAPTVAGQAAGNVLYKELSDTLDIDIAKGNSVQALVNTTTTAGSGIPAVLVVIRSETNANLAVGVKSS